MIKILLILIQLLFILRFHFELSKMNGFIEPVNTIRRITNPFVLPIKKLIPWYQVKKSAAIIVAFLIGTIMVLAFNRLGLANAVLTELYFLIDTWIMFLQYGMFLFVIGSWIQIPALQRINTLLYQLFEPMLRPIRRFIPSFGGLDFSPIIFLFALSFIGNAFTNLFANLLMAGA
ncbi:MAG: YggT family protein [Gammaproteobacteria bacterium]|nr:YggT family protein [Gammaproteobacteria bacterium]